MSADGARGITRFASMVEADLPWVLALEQELQVCPWTRGNFVDSLASGHLCRIMKIGAEPVGYGVMMQVVDEAHLLDLGVDARHQRAGHGQQLLEHLFELVRARGTEQCFLEVRASNAAAIALYRKAGFAQIGLRRGYYPAAEGREDAIVMKATL